MFNILDKEIKPNESISIVINGIKVTQKFKISHHNSMSELIDKIRSMGYEISYSDKVIKIC